MLEGVNSEDKEMVTTVKGVIKAVLDGVKVRAGSRRPCSGSQPTEAKNVILDHTGVNVFRNCGLSQL